jgi:hypothetical protein
MHLAIFSKMWLVILIKFLAPVRSTAKRRGRMLHTPISYSGISGLHHRLRAGYPFREFFFSFPPGKYGDSDHDHFLTHNFKLFTYKSSCILMMLHKQGS